ncbi:hypothetical protein Hanom_Chr09g00790351 [Helianthus anomalus]
MPKFSTIVENNNAIDNTYRFRLLSETFLGESFRLHLRLLLTNLKPFHFTLNKLAHIH